HMIPSHKRTPLTGLVSWACACLSILLPPSLKAQSEWPLQIVKSFGQLSGSNPQGNLIQGGDGALYGTTYAGGGSGHGTVFRVNPDGTGYAAIHSFSYSDGSQPYAGLIQGNDGALYGTTAQGGSIGNGTVFRINPDGSGYAVLHSFAFGADGANPYAGLIQGSDGALYGTTMGGGASGNGTVFKVNLDGSGYAVLRSFTGGDGAHPYAGLIQGNDGALY